MLGARLGLLSESYGAESLAPLVSKSVRLL